MEPNHILLEPFSQQKMDFIISKDTFPPIFVFKKC